MSDPTPDLCPFCESDSVLSQTGTSNTGLPVYAVQCQNANCSVKTPDLPSMAAAAAVWDARPADAYLIHDWDAEVTTYANGSLVAYKDELYAGLAPELGSAPGTKLGEWMLLAN